MIYAAIDLGTVTSRLMLGRVFEGNVNVLKRSIIITNIGEGLTQSGRISLDANNRLQEALLQFKDEIASMQEEAKDELLGSEIPVKAVATSAMRDASNAADILADAKRIGFDIEVISGKREAELSFKGTLSGFNNLSSPVMSIDIGGGSAEAILGDENGNIITSHSFDIGCRRITEMFLKNNPLSIEEMDAAGNWAKEETTSFFANLPQLPCEVIAVAGTATSAVTIRDAIVKYDSSLVHGQRLKATELASLINALSTLNLEEREQVRGLHPGRASVIVGGLIVLEVMLRALKKDSLFVSDVDILQGIILDEATIC